MTEKEMIDAYGEFTTLYEKWDRKRSDMPLIQLEKFKQLVLSRIEIDRNYGMLAVRIDNDIKMKRSK